LTNNINNLQLNTTFASWPQGTAVLPPRLGHVGAVSATL